MCPKNKLLKLSLKKLKALDFSRAFLFWHIVSPIYFSFDRIYPNPSLPQKTMYAVLLNIILLKHKKLGRSFLTDLRTFLTWICLWSEMLFVLQKFNKQSALNRSVLKFRQNQSFIGLYCILYTKTIVIPAKLDWKWLKTLEFS